MWQLATSTNYRIDEQINTQTGWGIQKNSEYSEPLNHWLHKLGEWCEGQDVDELDLQGDRGVLGRR